MRINGGKWNDRTMAYALLRVVLGINIALHGFSRIYGGPVLFAQSMVPQFAKTPLPSWSVYAFCLTIPFAEALIGLLVLFGLGSRVAYVLGLLQIAALTFGSTLRQDWTASSIQLTYALLYAILLAFCEYNTLSVDTALGIDGRS